MAQMTLILGFGGTGAHVLTYLKELAVYKHGTRPENVAFLEFDTIADWEPGKTVHMADGAGAETIASGLETGTSLDIVQEYFQLKDSYQPTMRDLVERLLPSPAVSGQYPQYKGWLHANQLTKVMPAAALNITLGAAQQRQVGRYAMFANLHEIERRLDEIMSKLSRDGSGAQVNLWLVASAAGGTGAGCLMDAAYLAYRTAHKRRLRTVITGVVVLPDVYSNTFGVRPARAYSLFRELDRMQEKGIHPSDRYIPIGTTAPISQEVRYGKQDDATARVPTRLFDYLVYLGKDCKGEGDRVAFFRSVANAMDPYIDANVGTKMMEDLVNRDGRPIGLGAARLNVPVTTYADLYAWLQVEEYLTALTAPKDKDGQTVGVHSGAERDRKAKARDRVEMLLPLFAEMLKLDDDGGRDKVKELVTRFTPKDIVLSWYQFAAPETAGHKCSIEELGEDLPLAFVDPFRSLIKPPGAPLTPTEINVKTFDENKSAKGPKEDQERSRERFGDELGDVQAAYLDSKGGTDSLERGRRMVRRVVAETLRRTVDKAVMDELSKPENRFVDPGAVEQGTVLTRAYAELEILASREGPLGQIENFLQACVEAAGEQLNLRRQVAADSRKALQGSAKSMFGTWVQKPQEQARTAAYDYVGWQQKALLLEDMKTIVAGVRKRFEDWYRLADGAITKLALPREGGKPALQTVRRDHVLRLKDRLLRMRRGTSTFITLAPDSETDIDEQGLVRLQGFEKELRSTGTLDQGRSLAARELEATVWEAGVDDNGVPWLRLNRDDAPRDPAGLVRLHSALYDRFHPIVRAKLETIDVFDYIQFLQTSNGLELKALVKRLNKVAGVLLNGGLNVTCRWVYQQPSGADKQNIAVALHGQLRDLQATAKDPISIHSDRTSITLLQGCDTDGVDIPDVSRSADDYIHLLATHLGMGEDDEVKRALIYHPFRAESEAWYIERSYWRRRGQAPAHPSELMPPRIVRLLDKPERVLAFVHAVATETVTYDNDERLWQWHGHVGAVKLTSPGGDMLKAAITFVLQEREEATSATRMISLDAALDCARKAADAKKKAYLTLITSFVQDAKLDLFLAKAFPLPLGVSSGTPSADAHKQETGALKMIFQFYGNVEGQGVTTAELADRMVL